MLKYIYLHKHYNMFITITIHLFTLYSLFPDIVKQLEKQYNLPLQVGYSSMRGFFIQIPCKLLPPQKELPSIFLKVNKYKSFITCTTEDLVSIFMLNVYIIFLKCC